MFTFSIPSLKFRFIAISLLILSTIDAVFTDIGLRMLLIEEANPIVRRIYEDSLLGFYFIKIGLPAALVWLLPRAPSTRLVNSTLVVALMLYSSVFLYHLVWSTYAYVLYAS
ncbi:DUF5658 family protein [Bacillus sp. FJAT-45350]|uniref:DUF5658 family protein n=1 Tax=Bacillus sp. FJAT-45350 TaxID=2011014 RepID=UPI000BB8CE2F|nr:DUF5658 family protein [Bacillus sp. FJAT-45350]